MAYHDEGSGGRADVSEVKLGLHCRVGGVGLTAGLILKVEVGRLVDGRDSMRMLLVCLPCLGIVFDLVGAESLVLLRCDDVLDLAMPATHKALGDDDVVAGGVPS